ncbi:MAG: fenitrothion hydrolase, partial [Candidatus Limnocylindria bacterium]
PDLGMVGQTAAMFVVVGVIASAYLGASWVAHRTTGGRTSTIHIAQRFAHTLVPIGIAYAIAHYFTLVIYEGQQIISAASDPFGVGWDLFGTAERRIDFFIRRPEPVWYAQVAVIVTGHVMGVVLAHDRALADFAGADAVRSQYAMLVLMVLLTGLGLVILAG